MLLIYRRKATAIVLLLCIHATCAGSKSKPLCPIGFTTAFTKEKGDAYCVRLKGPEDFTDNFSDCTDNQFTTRLYKNLIFNKPPFKLWSEFKTLYPGGPFVDWSYTDSTGDVLLTTFEVKYNSDLGIDENLCTILEISGNHTAVRCDEKHFRFCVIKPYNFDDVSNEGCEKLQDYQRFWSPRATCLSAVTGVTGGKVRATWKQGKELCNRRGGALLQRGWRYANNPVLHVAGSDDEWSEPLGMVMSPAETLMWINEEDGNKVVPDTEWNFKEESFDSDTSLVSLKDDAWHLVNSSYIFYHVICERSIHLRNVSLNLHYDSKEGQLGLTVNDTSVDENKIWCFTDSLIFYPNKVDIDRIDETNKFLLKPIADGYYWCIHSDSKNFRVSESNKELMIRDKSSVMYLYAIKIRAKRKYNFENLEKINREWTKKLSEYIFLMTKYKQMQKINSLGAENRTEDVLKKFKNTHKFSYKDNVIHFLKIKRVFLDGKTALLHVQVNSSMEQVPPGFWDDLEVVYMKPAFYCKGFGSVPMTALGNSTTINCRIFSCLGDFIEGVQWVETVSQGCDVTVQPPVSVTSAVVFNDLENGDDGGVVNTLARNTNHIKSSESDSSESEAITTTIATTTVEDVAETTTDDPDYNDESKYPRPTSTTVPEVETVTPTVTVETTTEEFNVYCSKPSCMTNRPWTTTTARPTTVAPENATVTPEEQLATVLESLGQLLQDSAEPLQLEDIDNAFNEVDHLLDIEDELEIPSELLHLLDELGARVELEPYGSAATVRNNVALLMANSGPEAPVRGLKITSRENEAFTEEAFQILSDEPNSTQLSTNESEAVIHLPQSVADSERRISFVVFRNDRAFPPTAASRHLVNSRVLSVNVENITDFKEGETIDLHFRPITPSADTNMSRSCAFWQFLEDGSGVWSEEGCTFIPASEEGLLDTCRCTHLTHFAEVLVPVGNFSTANEKALEILSMIGCIISLIGLFVIGLTAALFRSWRRDFNNKIWLQLCIAIFLLCTSFLVIAFVKFTVYNVSCLLVGLVLHYSTLASCCWMLVAAVLSYRRLVLVFTRDASHKLLRASAFAWGAPFAVIGILLSVDPLAYAGRFDEETLTQAFCYPSGLAIWLSGVLPVAVIILANWTLFALIVRSVFASRRIQRHGDSKEALRCATVSCLLVFMFGLPWIFGLFANNIVAAYLFIITSTMQGFVLFIFFVVGNKKTRDLWLNKLKIKQTRQVPVTSSTYKSTGGPWKPGSVRGTSIEANMSKPRSLKSTDDSRFS